MGSNALIRRKALEAIGGYRPGLAEDLATSIALHYGGWSSAYVAEPLAPGLSPSSMAAWSIQQLKWARGVFELLITAYPKKFRKLSHGQRLSYAVRMTKYWIGPAVFVHLAATILILFFGTAATRGAFHEYLLHIGPLLGVDALIRAYTLRSHRHADLPPSSLLGAVVLIYASWPIYLLAWTLAVLRFPVKFMPTPKDTHQRLRFVWLLPQFISMVLLLGGMLYTSLALNHPLSALLAFASGQAVIQFLLLLRWAQADLLVRVPRSRKPVSSR
jgi:cellulose synthase/poly-beta-1,6-N-acetylglucosamine synthase-like glycosyltransferase